MRFEYAGDDGSRIVSWFKGHLRAIETCVNEDLPEASLTLIYSGIGTFGLLAALPGAVSSTRPPRFQNLSAKGKRIKSGINSWARRA